MPGYVGLDVHKQFIEACLLMSRESNSIGVALPLHGKVSKHSLLNAFSLPITS